MRDGHSTTRVRPQVRRRQRRDQKLTGVSVPPGPHKHRLGTVLAPADLGRGGRRVHAEQDVLPEAVHQSVLYRPREQHQSDKSRGPGERQQQMDVCHSTHTIIIR